MFQIAFHLRWMGGEPIFPEICDFGLDHVTLFVALVLVSR